MVTDELQQYVSRMKALGKPEIKIRETLALAKWPQEDINQVLGGSVDVSPTTPSSVMPQVQSAGNKTDKKLFFTILLIVIFLVGIGMFMSLYIRNKNSNTKVVNLNKGGKNQILTTFEDLSKYDKDTDGDGYPDFIETSMGLDPLISEYTRCKGNNTCAGAASQNTVKKKNVMIILDASGSMGLLNNGRTRMDAAKDALKRYVSSVQTSDINMGLMVYGHKGSNSPADKAISCASAEQLAPIGTITSANLDTYLDLIKPTGWTPIGLAITNARASFVGKEGENNEIMLVTDGDETCDSNPVEAATAMSGFNEKNVRVNVIAFAVSAKEVANLFAIAKAGRGSFAAANNSDELIARMNDFYENLKNIKDEKVCQSGKPIYFLNCYADTNKKVYKYVGTQKRTFYQKQISKAEFDRLDKLETAIWDQGQKANKE